ncbi:MAG: FecR family protein [Prevotellaceae bacterium]|nr:FecR family protein [Prevotellaceae bacterium]
MLLYVKYDVMNLNYSTYKPEDFASNESYLNYFFGTKDADIAFWKRWIEQHPEKAADIKAADELIALLSLQMPKNEFEKELKRTISIVTMLHKSNYQQQNGAKIKHPKRKFRTIAVAAAACAILLAGFLLTRNSETKQISDKDLFAGTEVVRIKSNEVKTVQLDDGSVVRLSPGAMLTYPSKFDGAKREVYLAGEALFEVSRDEARPFFVYCGNLVTHVLGTSFIVKADPASERIVVEVITGKVEVSENISSRKALPSTLHVSTGVILTPNQKVIYSPDAGQFETCLVNDPAIVAHEYADTSAVIHDKVNIPENIFVFEAVTLDVILSDLKTAYNIDIVVENSNILNCHFSGDISDMNLYRKLDLICKALNYSYEVKGTNILIRGKGCSSD